jgi:hypothetical protein
MRRLVFENVEPSFDSFLTSKFLSLGQVLPYRVIASPWSRHRGHALLQPYLPANPSDDADGASILFLLGRDTRVDRCLVSSTVLILDLPPKKRDSQFLARTHLRASMQRGHQPWRRLELV